MFEKIKSLYNHCVKFAKTLWREYVGGESVGRLETESDLNQKEKNNYDTFKVGLFGTLVVLAPKTFLVIGSFIIVRHIISDCVRAFSHPPTLKESTLSSSQLELDFTEVH